MVSDPASSVGVVAPLVSADELAVVSAVEVSAASVRLGAASVVGLSAIVEDHDRPFPGQSEGDRDRPRGTSLLGHRLGITALRSSAFWVRPVFLDLHVKVAKDWQRNPRQLRKLGF